jgi:exodeoxyribonuclease V beta subunit
VDLVFQWNGRFYLADWKSNYLGGDVGAYGEQALRGAMARELYVLQYHLYAVALDRYLSFRIARYAYEQHFGGIYYLFLRGMDPSSGPKYGIYRDRPQEGLIRELSRCLHAGTVEVREGVVEPQASSAGKQTIWDLDKRDEH